MTILCDVKVLEDWLEMNAFVSHSCPIFLKQVIDFLHLFRVCSKVLSSSQQSVVLSNWGYSDVWVLVNTSSGESFVDACNKVCVFEESLRVIGLVLVGQSFELII